MTRALQGAKKRAAGEPAEAAEEKKPSEFVPAGITMQSRIVKTEANAAPTAFIGPETGKGRITIRANREKAGVDEESGTGSPLFFGKKFCDVKIEGGKVFLKNLEFGGEKKDIELSKNVYKNMVDSKTLRQEDLLAEVQRVDGGIRMLQLVFENGVFSSEIDDSKPFGEQTTWELTFGKFGLADKVNPKNLKLNEEDGLLAVGGAKCILVQSRNLSGYHLEYDGSPIMEAFSGKAFNYDMIVTRNNVFLRTPENKTYKLGNDGREILKGDRQMLEIQSEGGGKTIVRLTSTNIYVYPAKGEAWGVSFTQAGYEPLKNPTLTYKDGFICLDDDIFITKTPEGIKKQTFMVRPDGDGISLVQR